MVRASASALAEAGAQSRGMTFNSPGRAANDHDRRAVAAQELRNLHGGRHGRHGQSAIATLSPAYCALEAAVSDAPLACDPFCGSRVGDFAVEPFDMEVEPLVAPVFGALDPAPPWPAPFAPPATPAPALVPPPPPCPYAAPSDASANAIPTVTVFIAFMITSLE